MATSVSSTLANVSGNCGGEIATIVSAADHHHQHSSSPRKPGMSNNSTSTPGTSAHGSVIQVPLVRDTLTFDGRQASRLRDMERRAEAEIKRKKRELEREIQKMRDEFIHLYPSDRKWSSAETLQYEEDPLISQRCGSTDILDEKKMRTLFVVDASASNIRGFASGSGTHHSDSSSGRIYRIRFDTSGCDATSVRVSTDGDRIVVRANKIEPVSDNEGSSSGTRCREYCRKIQKPKDVDHTKFKSYLTSDAILIVEAPMTLSNLSVRRTTHSPSHSSRSISPSGSPAPGGPDTPSKEKVGVPVFRDENGQRRLHLIVDVGSTFKPEDIIVQVIKDNKIQVRAKHEEKTTERLSKSKFSKEYELSEKIETYSLTGGLANDGRLIVGAFAKGHGEGSFSKPGSGGSNSTSNTVATAGGAVNGTRSSISGANGAGSQQVLEAGGEMDAGPAAMMASVVDDVTGHRKSVAIEPCEVRSSMPTTSSGR